MAEDKATKNKVVGTYRNNQVEEREGEEKRVDRGQSAWKKLLREN